MTHEKLALGRCPSCPAGYVRRKTHPCRSEGTCRLHTRVTPGKSTVDPGSAAGQLRKYVGGAAQAGEQQHGLSVPAPVQIVEEDAVEGHELVGEHFGGFRHRVTV